MATMRTLKDLMLDELRDIYHAEKQITRALPKMIKAATSPQLRAGFEQHLQETVEQVERLEQCFSILDVRARGKTCEAMQGIIEEGSKVMEEDMEPEVLDAALLASAQKVEHYEISAYGTLITWAKNLGIKDVARLLEATLAEEKATDEKLTKLANADINKKASAQPTAN
jgi:ferritin-like metal-binding protein YciE